MKNIVIVGNGGLAKEIAEYIDYINENNPTWNLLGYSTNDPNKLGGLIHHYKIFCLDELLLNWGKQLDLVIGVGFPQNLYKISSYFSVNSNLNFPNIIHPKAFLAKYILIERGNIITPGVIL